MLVVSFTSSLKHDFLEQLLTTYTGMTGIWDGFEAVLSLCSVLG